jgi:hypothetical protein
MTHPVAHVVALSRYPVKSMAGEPLQSAELGFNGFAGDRRWAFVRGDQLRSDFPWLTIRERADLTHHVAHIDGRTTYVTTPDGECFDVADPELARRLGHDARPIKQNRGVFDAMPLSLISTQTVRALSQAVDLALDPRRFRPNILIDAAGETEYPEDGWIGRTLRIGEIRMRVDQRDQRCVITTIDPDTLDREPRVLRTIAQQRDACTGVYGSTVTPGTIRVGDPVTLE